MNDRENERLGHEKRRHVRIDVELCTSFKISGDAERKTYKAVTKNISHGGVCLAIYEELEEVQHKMGDSLPQLQVSIELTDHDGTLEAVTKTAWISSRVDWVVHPRGEGAPILMGMAFHDLDEEDEDKINNYVADLLIKQREARLGD